MLQVSERFAQYIDQMVQSSGMADSSMERLQHFLEPILFLSGLELANTFEHFYRCGLSLSLNLSQQLLTLPPPVCRYYLGDRLLARGNVWLETTLVDQIGSCFPSRFPQQMLKNLSESAELQQEFHLYRLQQLDRRLQEQVSPEPVLFPAEVVRKMMFLFTLGNGGLAGVRGGGGGGPGPGSVSTLLGCLCTVLPG